MSITAAITQTDGEFLNGKTEIEFIEQQGTYQFTKNQICKVNVTDTTNSANNITDVPAFALDGTLYYNTYNNSTGTWNNVYDISDLSGYNIVIKRIGNNDYYNIYFAKDSELLLIPDYTTDMRIRYRMTSNVSINNLASYKRLGSSSHPKTPIVPCFTRKYQSKTSVGYIAAEVGANNNLSFSIVTIDLTNGAEAYGADTLRFPTFNSFIELANSEIQDLETRVSILESEISSLQKQVAAHDKILKDLPAIVSAVSSDVSKLYVAR